MYHSVLDWRTSFPERLLLIQRLLAGIDMLEYRGCASSVAVKFKIDDEVIP